MRVAILHPSRQRLSWLVRSLSTFVAGITLAVMLLTSRGLQVSWNRDAKTILLQYGVVTITIHETIGSDFVSVLQPSPAAQEWKFEWMAERASWRAPFALWRPEIRDGAVPGIYLNNFTGRFRQTTIPLWPVAAVGLLISIPSWRVFLRSRHRLRNGLCVCCAYPTSGLPRVHGQHTRCPECGCETADAVTRRIKAPGR